VCVKAQQLCHDHRLPCFDSIDGLCTAVQSDFQPVAARFSSGYRDRWIEQVQHLKQRLAAAATKIP